MAVTGIHRDTRDHEKRMFSALRLRFGVSATGSLTDFDGVLRQSPAKSAHDIGKAFAFTLAAPAIFNAQHLAKKVGGRDTEFWRAVLVSVL